eukprot:CAMPEP_0202971208 /NCGR_PEP_ID=MMETSP1396-20130829/24846_1 /ASSEMBLY_ACC=CAM_ASM_000872 /TAXON_ID= /ORGANISM="Pseudokeronopsis sp., Strain Brazil" /LENGTH=177 /DNA_ID=CAMNT_0049700377 /DNA_START=897 /DNA_END=1430 /DNA_ORIENTATION=+
MAKRKHPQKFPVILMDAPWDIAMNLKYPTLTDNMIAKIPMNLLQSDGYLFMWVINSHEEAARTMMKKWGYAIKDKFVWVKVTIKGKLVNGSGYYLRHSEELCLVGVKGNVKDLSVLHKVNNVIVSNVRGESVKPDELYNRIEQLVPDGPYLEIFARWHNIRKRWVSIGNQLREHPIQ